MMQTTTTVTRTGATAAAALLSLALFPLSAAAQGPSVTTQHIANVPSAVWAGAPRGDEHRLFVLSQSGAVRLIDLSTNTLLPTPFLTITGLQTGAEAGLLGMAFHPEFASNGYFWIYATFPNARRVVRYRVNGDPMTATTADPDSAQITISIPGTIANHNAGWIDFGADGHLYIAVGDGGNSSTARTLTNELRGKLLRIDVDGPDNIPGNDDDDGFPADPLRHYTVPANNPYVGVTGDDEIWAYGLRNPWRNDIDPATGDLYIADVGQNAWEEINFQPAGDLLAFPGDAGYYGGRSYGWSCYEGNAGSGTACGQPPHLTFPFLVYGHGQIVPPTNHTGCSITGGIVYRGCAIPELDGMFLFADYCRGRIFAARYDGTDITEFFETGIVHTSLTSFGRDGRGEAYICASSAVRKIVPTTLIDINGDGIADSCVCPADWNGSGNVDSNDISAFLATWLTAVMDGTPAADYDRDGVTNSNDISAFLSSWLAALTGGC